MKIFLQVFAVIWYWLWVKPVVFIFTIIQVVWYIFIVSQWEDAENARSKIMVKILEYLKPNL